MDGELVMAKKKQYTVIVRDQDGNEIVTGKIDHKDFHMELNNDLAPALNLLGNLVPASLYSKGTYINITGYIKNKNMKKEMKEAMRDNAKNARRR